MLFVERDYCVVLEFGSSITRAGFSCECSPRAHVATPPGAFTDADKLQLFLKHLLLKLLHVTPSECKVVVCESFPGSPFRIMLAKVLFDLKVAAVMFCFGSQVATLFCDTQRDAILTVDIGEKETRVLPIVDGRPLISCFRNVSLGVSDVAKLAPPDVCFVLPRDKSPNFTKQQPDMQAQVWNSVEPKGGIGGALRAHAAEVLWRGDEEDSSVATAVLQCVLSAPVDLRLALASSVLILGGAAAALPGLRLRLQQEFRALADQRSLALPLHFCTHKHEAAELQWLGASVLGSSINLMNADDGVVTIQSYTESGVIPDPFEIKE